MRAVLSATPPPSSVLLALSVDPGERDEVGLWIWERLTCTHLDEWSTSSLLLEWRVAHGERRETECPAQVFAERRVDSASVSDLALERMSSRHGHHAKPKGLDAEALTHSAVEHLRHGRWEVAADVFAGLLALRPTDGDAWNNLGFCQLPGDRMLALRSLQQASFYERREPFVNTVNRALALHLVGRDDDSVRISDTALTAMDQEQPLAFLWRYDNQGHELKHLVLEDPRVYLTRLRDHVVSGDCETASHEPRVRLGQPSTPKQLG